jgi:DNA-binding MarR family transcriptional regulator
MRGSGHAGSRGNCGRWCSRIYFGDRTIRRVDDSNTETTESRDTLEREIVGLIHQISHHGRQMFMQGLARDKLTLTHWMILEQLNANRDGLTMRAIADSAGMTPSSVTGLVDALEAKGWTARQNDPSDRRVVRVALTKSGVKQVQRIGEHLFEQYRVSMQDMNQTQLELIHQMYGTMLERMRSSIAASKQGDEPQIAASRGGKS